MKDKNDNRVWRIKRITFTQSEIDAMTLEDFGPPPDEEDKELLRSSKSELTRNLASDDPEVRLQANKELLAQMTTIKKDKPLLSAASDETANGRNYLMNSLNSMNSLIKIVIYLCLGILCGEAWKAGYLNGWGVALFIVSLVICEAFQFVREHRRLERLKEMIK